MTIIYYWNIIIIIRIVKYFNNILNVFKTLLCVNILLKIIFLKFLSIVFYNNNFIRYETFNCVDIHYIVYSTYSYFEKICIKAEE